MKVISEIFLFSILLFIGCQPDKPKAKPEKVLNGALFRYKNFPSEYVLSRNIDVWVPPGYKKNKDQHYSVIYINDGQNIFLDSLSYTKISWGMDETMSHLIETGKIKPAIVVAIWNTPRRMNEYMPQEPLEEHPVIYENYRKEYNGPALSDKYLAFIVNELRPFINQHYHVDTEASSTFMIGSSMGGLISLYALCKYPGIFGGAGCLSTHWPIADSVMISYIRTHLPSPEDHVFYFDHGTKTLDSQYAPYQNIADQIFINHDYKAGINYISRVFPSDDHSEKSWRRRLAYPLELLLKKSP